MTFGNAMSVVSRFGRDNDCTSFIEAIIEMENRYSRLSASEQDAFDTVVSEYEMMAKY